MLVVLVLRKILQNVLVDSVGRQAFFGATLDGHDGHGVVVAPERGILSSLIFRRHLSFDP